MSQEATLNHRMYRKILLTAGSCMHIIQIKGCSWGVQTALLLFPTFQKMEPRSIVRLCHAPVFAARGRQMQAAGHLPAFNSG